MITDLNEKPPVSTPDCIRGLFVATPLYWIALD